jgi:DnaA family protein
MSAGLADRFTASLLPGDQACGTPGDRAEPTGQGMRQLPLDLGPSSPAGLDDFVPGRNLELLTWLHAWPDSAPPGTPVYLWGDAGSGKTHLLRGLASRALAQGWHVLWLGRTGFHAWDTPVMDAATLVLIDDAQALDATQQHWAFNLFIENAAALASQQATGQGAQPVMALVAAGRMPPTDLPVRDDLRSRLGWGLVFGVQALSEPDTQDALVREAKRRGLRLGEGVVPYLMTHFSRNLGDLMSLMERLDRYAMAEQRIVTVPLLKQMLAQETP